MVAPQTSEATQNAHHGIEHEQIPHSGELAAIR